MSHSNGLVIRASSSALVDAGDAHEHKKSHSLCSEGSYMRGSGRENSCTVLASVHRRCSQARSNAGYMCFSTFSESSRIHSHRPASFSSSVWATTRRVGICCTNRDRSSNSSAAARDQAANSCTCSALVRGIRCTGTFASPSLPFCDVNPALMPSRAR